MDLRAPVVWRLFVNARWPWPPLLVTTAALAFCAAGLSLADGDGQPLWLTIAGVIMFVISLLVALAMPLVWRDARRARQGGRHCG